MGGNLVFPLSKTASIGEAGLHGRVRNHVVIATMGTLGDLLPFVQLAQELIGRGYRVTVLTSWNWKSLVLQYGAEFVGVAEPDPAQDDPAHRDIYKTHWIPAFRRSLAFIEKAVDPESAILVYWLHSLGAECAAEKLGIPSAKIVLQPAFVFSWHAPPWPLSRIEAQWPGLLQRSRLLRLLIRLRWRLGRMRRQANAFRVSVGCRPAPLADTIQRGEDLMLFMFPPWYAPPQADWPSRGRCVGFPQPRALSPEAEVAAFIRRNGPPIVFTRGTGARVGTSDLEMIAEVCARLGASALVLSGDAKPAGTDSILVRPFVDLDAILMLSRLFVHHGGIGSTAAAIRAGVPQIVSADRFDQPDNAERVVKLGLGRAIAPKDLTADRLCHAIASLEADQNLPARLARAQMAALDQNGIVGAADAISSLASRGR